MKTTTFGAAIFGAFLLAGCVQEKVDDAEVLNEVLTAYFDGVKNRDLNKLNAITTDDFVLFENGKIWNNDSLINVVKARKKFEGKWTFTHIRTNIDVASGSIVYYNHADFVIDDTTKNSVDWIESATFRKIDGQWKMNFLHSTVRK